MTKITIFTPTYNRAYIIDNLYQSLRRQTVRNFEWLVIDDGSTDETEALFKSGYCNAHDFSVRYYYQPNGGKCRAINKALDLAKGELFYVVDSDDVLSEDAVEKILQWDRELKTKKGYCGYAANMGVSAKNTPNRLSGRPYVDATLLDRYRFFDGEKAFIFFTDVARRYKYPVFEGEKFMTEAVVYNRMAHDGFKIRYYDDIICIYEYQEDGLTQQGSKLFLRNPRGYGLWISEKNKFEKRNLCYRMRSYYTFVCDLSGFYDLKTISECIDVPYIVSVSCYYIHCIRSFFVK